MRAGAEHASGGLPTARREEWSSCVVAPNASNEPVHARLHASARTLCRPGWWVARPLSGGAIAALAPNANRSSSEAQHECTTTLPCSALDLGFRKAGRLRSNLALKPLEKGPSG